MSARFHVALIASLACTSACFSYSDVPPERPAPKLRSIKDASILDMKVHLLKQRGLCPGLEGKLYANANVQWPGSKPVPRNIGADVDSLQPSDFDIAGPLLKGDVNAHLFPDPDVLKSVFTGFDAKIIYKPNPKFSFQENFWPEYSCYTGWFADGEVGGPGEGGGDGNSGGQGQSGGNGGSGRTGESGAPGGQIVALVTLVSTKYYPRLLAVIANDHFFLAPADRQLVFGASGGQGGQGGNGGSGGDGGSQPTKTVDTYDSNGNKNGTVTVGNGSPGNGGNGGSGGPGGQGGPGGSVDVSFDSAFPEIARFLAFDVRGGAGGYGGAPGGGGAGGGSSAQKNAQTGSSGGQGSAGPDGSGGRIGRGVVHAAALQSRFVSIPGIGIFGTPRAHELQAQSPTANLGGDDSTPSPPPPPPPPEQAQPQPDAPQPPPPPPPRKKRKHP